MIVVSAYDDRLVRQRAVALEQTPSILPDSLPTSIRGESPRVPSATADGLPESGFDLEAHVKDIERGTASIALSPEEQTAVERAMGR